MFFDTRAVWTPVESFFTKQTGILIFFLTIYLSRARSTGFCHHAGFNGNLPRLRRKTRKFQTTYYEVKKTSETTTPNFAEKWSSLRLPGIKPQKKLQLKANLVFPSLTSEKPDSRTLRPFSFFWRLVAILSVVSRSRIASASELSVLFEDRTISCVLGTLLRLMGAVRQALR